MSTPSVPGVRPGAPAATPPGGPSVGQSAQPVPGRPRPPVVDEAVLRAELLEVIARYPQPRSALLPMLHLVQAHAGFVTARGIELSAELLGLTEAEVSAVATFYTMYKRHPMGEYHVGVCTNTLCAVMGGDAVWEALVEHLGIGHDETTEDGRISLERVECNAACDYAPVVMVDWEFMDDQTPASARALVDALRAGEPVVSTRGPRICTFRQAERVLAGFPDGLAGEGPTAGPATLAGLELAREHGWEAPSTDAREREREGEAARPGPADAADQRTAVATSAHTDPAPAATGDPANPATPGANDPVAGTTGSGPASGAATGAVQPNASTSPQGPPQETTP